MPEGSDKLKDAGKDPPPKGISLTQRIRRLRFEGQGASEAAPEIPVEPAPLAELPAPADRAATPPSDPPKTGSGRRPASTHRRLADAPSRPSATPGSDSRSPTASPGTPGDGSSEISFLGKEWPPGREIEGQYVVQGVIGRGGMGIVYRCLDLARTEPVAIKAPLAHIVHSVSAKQRFVREAETWVNLGWHPHIVRAYRVMEFEWLPRIVLEYVDGGSLDELLTEKREGLSQELGLDIAIQICWGMAFAHDRKMIHRDLKPHNVLLTRDGTAKVTDLGLVRLPGQEEIGRSSDSAVLRKPVVPPGSVLTKDGALGTPAYMAPEQWESASKVEAPADIYAFGVMLYEVFCGRRPFEVPGERIHTKTEHRHAIYREQHLGLAPPDPEEFQPGLDGELRRAMLQCLEKKPDSRPANFRTIAAGLSAVYERLTGRGARGEPAASELDRKARLDQAWSLVSLGLGCRFRGESDHAMDFMARAVAAFRELDEAAALSSCYINMGVVCQDRGDFDRALNMFQKSLASKKTLNDRAGMSRCYTNIGAIHQARGDAERALATYAQSLLLKKESGDRDGMGKCYTNMGSIYRDRREYERALGMYELGLQIARELGNRAEMGSCYNNMGIVCKDQGNYDDALAMYERSLEIAHDLGDLAGVAKCLMNLGILLEEGMKRPDDALRLYEEALRRMRALGMPIPAGLPVRVEKLRSAS